MTFDASFWVAAAFAIFVLVFIRYALPVITKGLDGRGDAIRNELDEAQRLREEAQETLSAYQKRQREVMEDAERMLEQAKAEAETMKADAEAKLKAEVDRRIQSANDKIARSEAKALEAVQQNVVDIAMAAARALLEEQLTAEKDEELIKLAINDLDRIVH